MIPQIIIKNVDPTPNLWTKKQPKLFEDFLTKVNHLKNEVKEMELKLKSREETYKSLENEILSSLGIGDIIKTSNFLDFLESFNENLHNYEFQLIENQVKISENELKELELKRSEKQLEINEKMSKLSEFKKVKEDLEVQSLSKNNLKNSIKEIQGEINKLNYFLLELKKALNPQEETQVILNDDLVMLIENLLKSINKTESKISTRRMSLDFVESNFEKIELLEKELEISRKNQKKIIREYDEKINNDSDLALENYKAKIKNDLNNLEENYQKQLNLYENEIKTLESENLDFNNKLDELEKLGLEVNRKEKELNAIKLKWDELWSLKSDFERELEDEEAKIRLIPIKSKSRKSALR